MNIRDNKLKRLITLFVLSVAISALFLACSSKAVDNQSFLDSRRDELYPTLDPNVEIAPMPTLVPYEFPAAKPMFEWVKDEAGDSFYTCNLSEFIGMSTVTKIVDLGEKGIFLICGSGEEQSTIYELDFVDDRIYERKTIDKNRYGLEYLNVSPDGRIGAFDYLSSQDYLDIYDLDFNVLKQVNCSDFGYDKKLSSDCTKIYYCNKYDESESGFRIYDIEKNETTELTDVLKAQGIPSVYNLQELCFDSSVALINHFNDEYRYDYYFIDVNDGTVIREFKANDVDFNTFDDKYIALISDKGNQILYGDRNEASVVNGLLYFSDSEKYNMIYLNDMIFSVYNKAYTDEKDEHFRLTCYDTLNNDKIYQTDVSLVNTSHSMRNPSLWDEEKECVYGIASIADVPYLYKWNVFEDEIKNSARAVSYACDENGQAEDYEYDKLQEYADKIGEKYNVSILTCDNVDETIGSYETTKVNSIAESMNYVDKIDELLSGYPKEILEIINYHGEKEMRIQILGGLHGIEGNDVINSAVGLYNDEFEEHNLAFDCTSYTNFCKDFYHEMTHAIDFYIYDNPYVDEVYLDYNYEFSLLNDDKYYYDYSYVDNGSTGPQGTMYYEEDKDDVYFVDSYAKSFPTEDRARLVEHAIVEGKEYFEEYPHLMKKLEYFYKCLEKVFGISEFFGLETWF